MTTTLPTVTQELEEARLTLLTAEDAAMGDTTPVMGSIIEARLSVERALRLIQHARCDAVAALEKF
jgi:hypothetical protein